MIITVRGISRKFTLGVGPRLHKTTLVSHSFIIFQFIIDFCVHYANGRPIHTLFWLLPLVFWRGWPARSGKVVAQDKKAQQTLNSLFSDPRSYLPKTNRTRDFRVATSIFFPRWVLRLICLPSPLLSVVQKSVCNNKIACAICNAWINAIACAERESN